MSRTFKIPSRDYYNEGEIIFLKKQATIKQGLTVLVGYNGAGKSTLLQILKSELDENEVKYISFDNVIDSGSRSRERAGFYGDVQFIATSLCSSEGENIILNMGNVAHRIATHIRKNENEKELWILLDAVDSGLSIDNVIDLKDLFSLIIDDNKNKDIYIIISANEYELAREEQCFDVCNYITFKDYVDYRNFIIKSRKRKDERKLKNNL